MSRFSFWDPNSGASLWATLALVNNFTATADPGVGDDTGDGYQVGSVWVNTAADSAFVCVDATLGAAVWVIMSQGGSTQGQVAAPAASTPTGTGGAGSLTGGAGGTTSGTGGAASVTGGAGTAGASAGGAAATTGGAGSAGSGTTAGGAGGTGTVAGGAGGAKSGTGAAAGGAGGAAAVTGGAGGATASAGTDAGGRGGNATSVGGAGGAASAGTGNGGAGGSVIHTPGAGGSSVGGAAGVAGGVFTRGLAIKRQAAPAAKTVSATLTAAEVLTGIITVNQGGAATSALQLPTGTDLQAALPADFTDNDSFDVSVINISVVDAEDASITINAGMTLVGSMDFLAYSAAGLQSSGILRFRRTAANTFTVYRIA